MREYVLTKREKKILQSYIKENIKLDGFSVLAVRLKRTNKRLTEDFELITVALEQLEFEQGR